MPTDESGRENLQNLGRHIQISEEDDLISYLSRNSINWTYHHKFSERTVDESFLQMVADCLATYHDDPPITPRGYITDEVRA